MPISSYRLHSPHRFNTTHGETEFNVSLLSGDLEEWKEWDAVDVWKKLFSKASLDVSALNLKQFVAGDKKIERSQTLMRSIKALVSGLSEHSPEIQYQEWYRWVERYHVPVQWQRWAYPFMSFNLLLRIQASATDKNIPWFEQASSFFPNWPLSEPNTLWEKLVWEISGSLRLPMSNMLQQQMAQSLKDLLAIPSDSTVVNELSVKTLGVLWHVFLNTYVEHHRSFSETSPPPAFLSSLQAWLRRFQPTVSPTVNKAWSHAFDRVVTHFDAHHYAYSHSSMQIALNGFHSVLTQPFTANSEHACTLFIRNAEASTSTVVEIPSLLTLNPFSIQVYESSGHVPIIQTLWQKRDSTINWGFVLEALEKTWSSLSPQEKEMVRAQTHWNVWVEQGVKRWSFLLTSSSDQKEEMKKAAQNPSHVHRWLTLFSDWMDFPNTDVLDHVLHKVNVTETLFEYQKTHVTHFPDSPLNWTWAKALFNQKKQHDARMGKMVQRHAPKTSVFSLWETLSSDIVLPHHHKSLWRFALNFPLFQEVMESPQLLSKPDSDLLSDLLGSLGASLWYQQSQRLQKTLSDLPKEKHDSACALHAQNIMSTFKAIHEALPSDLQPRWWPMMFAQGVSSWLHSETSLRSPVVFLLFDFLRAWKLTLDSADLTPKKMVRHVMEHYLADSKKGSLALYGSFLPDLSTVLTDMKVFRELFHCVHWLPEEVPEFPVLFIQALSLVSNVNMSADLLALLWKRLDEYTEEHPLWRQQFQAFVRSSEKMNSPQLQQMLRARMEQEVLVKTLPESVRPRPRSPRL